VLPVRVTRDRADLLHVQYVAPPVARTPIVTAVHDLSFEDAPHHLPPAMRLRLRALVRLSVRRSAVVVTPSHFSRERLLCHLDVDPGNVFVTPPAVRLSPASAVPDRDSARLHHLGLPAQFVLFVGRVEPRKNVARLIAAVAAGRMGGAELGLVLAGSSGGRPTPDVEAAISSWSAGSWVRRLGYVSDDTLALLYRSARVVAYPSLYEGFGLPVLEAMAAGVPVVASAISAIPEVAGDAALLVDPEDVHALGEALLEAACDERTRARLATAGPARAAGFTAASFAASTMAAYRHALGG
jgi:glycosyltransferase involved in cell wall biosynthesis